MHKQNIILKKLLYASRFLPRKVETFTFSLSAKLQQQQKTTYSSQRIISTCIQLT